MNDRGTFKAKYTTPHGVEFYAELGTIEDASFGNSYYGSGESVREADEDERDEEAV